MVRNAGRTGGDPLQAHIHEPEEKTSHEGRNQERKMSRNQPSTFSHVKINSILERQRNWETSGGDIRLTIRTYEMKWMKSTANYTFKTFYCKSITELK